MIPREKSLYAIKRRTLHNDTGLFFPCPLFKYKCSFQTPLMQSNIYRPVVSFGPLFIRYAAQLVLISGVDQAALLALVLTLAPSHKHLDLVLVPVFLDAFS